MWESKQAEQIKYSRYQIKMVKNYLSANREKLFNVHIANWLMNKTLEMEFVPNYISCDHASDCLKKRNKKWTHLLKYANG